jgi:hypothetical protein
MSGDGDADADGDFDTVGDFDFDTDGEGDAAPAPDPVRAPDGDAELLALTPSAAFDEVIRGTSTAASIAKTAIGPRTASTRIASSHSTPLDSATAFPSPSRSAVTDPGQAPGTAGLRQTYFTYVHQ